MCTFASLRSHVQAGALVLSFFTWRMLVRNECSRVAGLFGTARTNVFGLLHPKPGQSGCDDCALCMPETCSEQAPTFFSSASAGKALQGVPYKDGTSTLNMHA
jgi:hypothetical protein